jgi:hypothetical protein
MERRSHAWENKEQEHITAPRPKRESERPIVAMKEVMILE